MYRSYESAMEGLWAIRLASLLVRTKTRAALRYLVVDTHNYREVMLYFRGLKVRGVPRGLQTRPATSTFCLLLGDSRTSWVTQKRNGLRRPQ